MRANDHDALELDAHEVYPLVAWLAARHLAADDDWLQWEDLPNLSEGSFDLLVEAVEDVVTTLLRSCRIDTDPAYLFEEASAWKAPASGRSPE